MLNFQQWLRLNRSRRTEIALLLGFIILIAVISTSGWRSAGKLNLFIQAADKDRHYASLVQELQSVINDVTTAESEQRGYVITGDRALLASYEAATARTHRRFNDLLTRTATDVRLHTDILGLHEHSAKVLKHLNDTLDLYRTGEGKRGQASVRNNPAVSAALFQRLREISTEYTAISSESRSQVVALRDDTVRSFILTAVLAAVVLAAMGITVMVEARFVRDLSNRLLRESRYDSLTGLPNRAYLRDTLARAILGAERAREKLGLLYMDLNGFKKINDTFGHNIGDQVLTQAARWFESTGRGADFVARLGGDEFAVVLPRVDDRNEVAAAAQRYGKLSISRGPHIVTTSVGYALFPDDGKTAEALTQLSDSAMYERKQKSKGL